VKFTPRRNQVTGRIVIKRMMSVIVRPDETKHTSKFILVDAVGSEAQEAGIKVGDIVVPESMKNLALDGGVIFRPILDEKTVMGFMTEVSLDELLVQTDNASKFVPFDADDAAKSICG
jgi:putative aminopeptidase FrvX